MSVLACDRNHCDNTMCDRLILDGTQYICESCWDELLTYKESWPEKMPLPEVKERILTFMDSRPGSYLHASGSEINREFYRLCGGK